MMYELPPQASGTTEQQLVALRDYLVRLARDLDRVGGSGGTASETRIVKSATSQAQEVTLQAVQQQAQLLKDGKAKEETVYPDPVLGDADMDVEVLAAAFNMEKAEFMGHRITVDSFGEMDTDRLDALFSGSEWYTTPTDDELAALDAIPGILVDKDWFMIFDNLINFTENYNGQGLYWNYFLHTWKTFSSSPFANAVVFVPGAPAITSVTVTPESATVLAGQSVQLDAEVVTANFASKVVNWTSSAKTVATVDIYGKVTVAADADPADTATITATSAVDNTKTDTCVITVGGEAAATTGE